MDPSTQPVETQQQKQDREDREREAKWKAERQAERLAESQLMTRVAFGGIALNGLLQRGANLPDALKQVTLPANIEAIDRAIATLFTHPVK